MTQGTQIWANNLEGWDGEVGEREVQKQGQRYIFG